MFSGLPDLAAWSRAISRSVSRSFCVTSPRWTKRGSAAAMCMATSRATSCVLSPALFATSSTITPILPPAWMYEAIAPPSGATKRAKRRMVMFSLIEAITSFVFSPTVPPPGHGSLFSSSTVLALLPAMTFATALANSRKASVRATKSVSQLTSTSTPTLPSEAATTAPSDVTRPAFLLAAASPFLRRILVASSMLPSASVSADFTSIMPAPVCSRSSLTIAAVICVICTSPDVCGVRRPCRRCWRAAAWPPHSKSDCRFGRRRLGDRDGGRFGLVLGSDEPFLGHVVAFQNGVGDLLREEADGADGVVVPGDHVVDVLGIAVRVDDGHDRDVQLLRLLDRDVLLLRVDDEERVGQPVHLADADQVLLELVALVLHGGALLLRHLLLRVVQHRLELLEALDRFPNRGEVRQRAAQPAVVHVEHAAAVGLFENRVLGLALGADEQDALPSVRDVRDVCGSFLEELERLLQVDDVDPVALAEDVLLHLRVPALGLMTEVDASFQ